MFEKLKRLLNEFGNLEVQCVLRVQIAGYWELAREREAKRDEILALAAAWKAGAFAFEATEAE